MDDKEYYNWMARQIINIIFCVLAIFGILLYAYNYDNKCHPCTQQYDSTAILKKQIKECKSDKMKLQGILLSDSLHKNCIRVWDK